MSSSKRRAPQKSKNTNNKITDTFKNDLSNLKEGRNILKIIIFLLSIIFTQIFQKDILTTFILAFSLLLFYFFISYKNNKTRYLFVTLSIILFLCFILRIYILVSFENNESNTKYSENRSTADTLLREPMDSLNTQKNNITRDDHPSEKDATDKIEESTNNDKKPGIIDNKGIITFDQKGGTNIVNQYNEKPLPPVEVRLVELLKHINPNLNKLVDKQDVFCICVNQINLNKLLEIKDSLFIKRIMEFKSTGSVMFGNTNQIGNCINDITDGMLHCYAFRKLENFSKLNFDN